MSGAWWGLIGLVAGVGLGVVVMCLMLAASFEDRP